MDPDFPPSYHVRREVRYLNCGIKWGKFQDGFPNLFIDNVKHVAGRDGKKQEHFNNNFDEDLIRCSQKDTNYGYVTAVLTSAVNDY